MRKPATIIATLALFLSLTGVGLAASHYVITSTKQIKPSVLKQLHGQTGHTGPQGPAGPAGPQGPAGPSNLSNLTTVVGPTVFVENGKVGGAEAVCPSGEHAVSGGGFGSIAGLDASEMESTHQSWFVITTNETGITVQIHATVECAGAGQAVAANAMHPTHARERQLIANLEDELAKGGRKPS